MPVGLVTVLETKDPDAQIVSVVPGRIRSCFTAALHLVQHAFSACG